MRLCMAGGKKAVFHCWNQISEMIEPSPLRNGHTGGIIKHPVGIIEYEDGTVESVPDVTIVFYDTKKLFSKLEKEYAKWCEKNSGSLSGNDRLNRVYDDNKQNADDNSDYTKIARIGA